ncbi:hypothetical protein STEG23_030162 [Scotinomys teguina]
MTFHLLTEPQRHPSSQAECMESQVVCVVENDPYEPNLVCVAEDDPVNSACYAMARHDPVNSAFQLPGALISSSADQQE